jgi:hypothetical protein
VIQPEHFITNTRRPNDISLTSPHPSGRGNHEYDISIMFLALAYARITVAPAGLPPNITPTDIAAATVQRYLGAIARGKH